MTPRSGVRSGCRVSVRAGRRAAFSYRGLAIALAVVAAVPAIAFSLRPQLPWSRDSAGPMMQSVERKDFVHEITERGTVESASNVEVRCEVKSRSYSSGITILYVVPEGTYVTPVPDWEPKDPDNPEDPPDLLVKLDSSGPESELTKQEIVCANSLSQQIQAQNTYDTAVIAKKEYEEGQYRLTLQEFEGKIVRAKEDYDRAQEYFRHSKELWEKGYITDTQYRTAEFDVEDKKIALDMAILSKDVFLKYQSDKELKRLQADIDTALARLEAAKHSYELDLEELEEIKTQIANCTIRAPEPGQVVYANVTDRRGGSEIIIEEGAQVRERQVIIRLPDPKRMQVKAKVNEAKIALVKPGQDVTIHLESFPDMELKGTVEKVNDYPAPSSWFMASVKEYETTIRVHDPPDGLRPGLTAEVKIRVEERPNVLQVPVQAVIEHKGRHYCVVRDGDSYRPKPVEIVSTNDKVVVLGEGEDGVEGAGLREGEQVVLNANALRDELDLPALPAETMLAQGRRGRPTAERSTQQPADSQPSGRPTIAQRTDQMLQRLDANGDGRLQRSEFPSGMKSLLATADTNGDDVIDRQELLAGVAQMPAGGRPGGRKPPAGEAGGRGPAAGGPSGRGARPGGRGPGAGS